MDTKIIFQFGETKLFLKFEDAVPAITIGSNRYFVNLSNIGKKAYIQEDKSSPNWRDKFRFYDVADKHEMMVEFMDFHTKIKIVPHIFESQVRFVVEGIY